jgi:hypothetical protein
MAINDFMEFETLQASPFYYRLLAYDRAGPELDRVQDPISRVFCFWIQKTSMYLNIINSTIREILAYDMI